MATPMYDAVNDVIASAISEISSLDSAEVGSPIEAGSLIQAGGGG